MASNTQDGPDGDEDMEDTDRSDDADAPENQPEDADAGPAPPRAATRPHPKRAGKLHRAAKLFAKASFAPQYASYKAGRKILHKFHVFGAGGCMGIGPDPTPECGDEITFDLYKTGNGFSGVARIPLAGGKALVTASSTTPSSAKAAGKAVNLTKLATSHPAVQALMPPQAALAAKVLSNPLAKKAVGKFLKKRW